MQFKLNTQVVNIDSGQDQPSLKLPSWMKSALYLEPDSDETSPHLKEEEEREG